jgi:hypothetical protein
LAQEDTRLPTGLAVIVVVVDTCKVVAINADAVVDVVDGVCRIVETDVAEVDRILVVDSLVCAGPSI